MLLDPDIAWFGGAQYPNQKENFDVFLDSMSDTWGRTLMKRRASPAFDINPSIDKDGLAINIDVEDNQLDIEIAKQVGMYFRLGEEEMNEIQNEDRYGSTKARDIQVTFQRFR
jgi:hypothetical protein